MTRKRYAYCIGANGPQIGMINSLKYAERDAQRVSDALKAAPCLFTETEWTTAVDRNGTLAGLKRFIERCSSADLLIIHFSGHAIYDGDLYLLCNQTDADDLVTSAIEIEAVKKMLSRCKAHSKVLILDCCHAGGAHSGAFKGEQEIKNELSTALQGSASVILSACSRRERTRELDTLDGGAGFLSWTLVSSCTKRFQEVSLDGFSLSITDVLRWIPTILREINGSLNEKERLPLPMALIEVQGSDGEIWLTEQKEHISQRSELNERDDKIRHLRAMVADHSGFMRDRLESFVGRQKELEDIRLCIAEKLQIGGYLTITGQAGQGKSSIIAKLVFEFGPENAVFHFIPLNPGPDHQVGLLRNLMAHLILKYQLPDIYVASESRAALRDYFPKVLNEVAAKGAKEVIFVDGLDQLEEDFNGVRDLSFLPFSTPPGILFVLGTRPNDTLRPLELLKPHDEYKLPNLSRHDFDLIIEHRHVHLKRDIADQFYRTMQENALYLDLVARELKEMEQLSPAVIIKRIANNPENLFSLSMDRLRRRGREWREVIKPVLGVLLAAREPLTKQHIRQILSIDADQLNEAIQRLGGLISDSGRQRYALFHLKLRDYLRQNESNPKKDYVFASDEEEGWHKIIRKWCEQSGIASIWQDVNNDPIEQGRREYARQHYIAHLYYAHEWQQLFQILDLQQFGFAKVHQDPSMRSYSLDLDFGRQAAVWEGRGEIERVKLLPRLWHYTLLKCSLRSRADQYPLAAFRILVLLGREREAQGLAEILTEPLYKSQALLAIANVIGRQQGRKQDSIQLLLRASEVEEAIIESVDRSKLAVEKVKVLTITQEWEWTETIIHSIERDEWRVEGLCELGKSFALAEQWEQAERVWEEAEKVISLIEDSSIRLITLCGLMKSFLSVEQWDRAMSMTRITRSLDEKIEVLLELGKALALDQQLEKAEIIWKKIEGLLLRITQSKRVDALCVLSESLALAGQLTRARVMWTKAERIVTSTKGSYEGYLSAQRKLGIALLRILTGAQEWEKAYALILSERQSWERMLMFYEFGKALMAAQRWKQAENVIRMIELDFKREPALLELVEALAQAQQRLQAERIWSEVESAIHTAVQDTRVSVTLRELVKALALNQLWDHASEVVDTIHDSRQRTEALGELGRALVLAQQWEKAQIVANKIKKNKERIGVLLELGKSLAIAQQWEQARLVWNLTMQEVDQIVEVRMKSGMWYNFAKELVQAQQWELAETIIRKIIPNSQKVQATPQNFEYLLAKYFYTSVAKIFLDIALALAKAQKWKRCEALLDEIEAIISTSRDSQDETERIKALAKALRARQLEQVEALLETQERERTEALLETQERERVEAAKILPESEIDAIKSPFQKSEALRRQAEALMLSQEWVRAEVTWDLAESVARSVQGRPLRINALIALVEALAKVKRWERAEAIAYVLETIEQKTVALRRIADFLITSKEYSQLLNLVKISLLQVETRDSAIQLLPLTFGLISLAPEIGISFFHAFKSVDNFFNQLNS